MADVNVITTTIELEANVKGEQKVNKLAQSLKSVDSVSRGMQETLSETSKAAKDAGNSVEETGKSAEKAEKNVKKSTSSFGKFFNQLKRIATYRLIRTALKAITSSFKEGIANLYQWSALNDGVFKTSMDSLATSLMYVKNALSTALAPVIQDIVVPAIYAISEAVADAVNWLNQLIAILKGDGTYTKAIRKQTEYAKATGGAAKELNRMLLGFDEINRLDDNSSSGGSSVDYGGMFETATIDETLSAKLESLKLTIGDVFFEWDNLNAEQKLEKAIVGTSGILGGIAGFMFTGTFAGGLVGVISGVAIGLLIDALTFDHDGEISKEEVIPLLNDAIGGLIGGILGFALMKNPAGALIGFEVGALVTAAVQNLLFSPDSVMDEGDLKDFLRVALGAVVGGIAGFAFTKNPQGAILGATVGTAITMAIVNSDFISQTSGTKDSLFNKLMPALMTVLAGAKAVSYLSAAIGVGAGTLIGFTLAVTLTLAIMSVDWTGKDLVTNAIKDVEKQGGSVNGAVNLLQEMDKANAADAVNKYQEDGKKKTLSTKTTLRANGGYVDSGSMFIAGESGAEFVGNINGRTGVMNTDQFGAVMQPTTEAIYAIGSAIVGAVNGIEMPSVRIGDRDIYRASERGKRLTGSSLVQGAR